MTHGKISQITGMSRKTVIRTLADFRKQHIAESDASTLLILNTTTLQELAIETDEQVVSSLQVKLLQELRERPFGAIECQSNAANNRQ